MHEEYILPVLWRFRCALYDKEKKDDFKSFGINTGWIKLPLTEIRVGGKTGEVRLSQL